MLLKFSFISVNKSLDLTARKTASQLDVIFCEEGMLKERGFKYVYQDGKFSWVHPVNINDGAIDCTDMPDAQFDLFVESIELRSILKSLALAAEVYAADQSKAPDPRCGLVQPVTVEEANRLNKELKRAWEILK